jgi:hypothetical protein
MEGSKQVTEFMLAHPWMTFFLVLAALDTAGRIVAIWRKDK